MSELYPPLAILQALTYRQAESESLRKNAEEHPEFRPLINTFGPHIYAKDSGAYVGIESEKSLNLDDLMNWTIGSTFCKQTYHGPYSFLNNRLLEIHHKLREKGHSYKQNRSEFRQSIAFATMFECWAKHKQVYRFDADFVDELLQTDTVELSADMLYHLPFRCFYLDIEEIPRFHPYIGVFVYVGYDEQNQLPNLAIFRIKDRLPNAAEGEYPIIASFCSGTNMLNGNILYRNEQDELLLQFTKNFENITILSDPSDKDVVELLFFVLQGMLYLTSNKPDMSKSPKRNYVNLGKKNDRKLNGHDLTLTDVGIRYGIAIRKAKEQTDVQTIYLGKTGKHRKPIVSYVRKAHWHTYWKGKGRTERIVRWIPPTFVSSHGTELPITIHNVKGEE